MRGMAKIKLDKPPLRPKRLLILQPECLEDLHHWVKTDSRMAMRLLRLMDAILRNPCAGTGKPEPLTRHGPNVWARRLCDVVRLVYRVRDDAIDGLQARCHC